MKIFQKHKGASNSFMMKKYNNLMKQCEIKIKRMDEYKNIASNMLILWLVIKINSLWKKWMVFLLLEPNSCTICNSKKAITGNAFREIKCFSTQSTKKYDEM